jgi:cell fate regulator YaaT (PSP1 superfamily)
MATIVGIQFQKNGKIYNYDANGLELRLNDYVVADTPHGIDLGQVAVGCRQSEDSDEAENANLKKVIRAATEKDLQTSADNRAKEREAYQVCQKKIAEHKLDMKLVSVEYSFDSSKALFYFTANGRVDFRSLVKDLASIFKMRIELRQIGVRDEARMLGGLGPCGRPICCGSFLADFQPVSIKMAKEQNLSLNPTKISGVCGRLMCCLKYEQDHYEQTRKIMPRVGREVSTPDGTGTVTDLNIVKETVFVRITNGDSSEIKEYALDKIEKTAVPAPRTDAPAEEGAETPEGTQPEKAEAAKQPESARKDQNRPPRHAKGGKGREAVRPGNRRENGEKGEPSRQQNQALGKPVMRENPNRNQAAKNGNVPEKQEKAEKPESAEKPEKAEAREEKTPEKKAEPSSNWADAVRRAIDSINE